MLKITFFIISNYQSVNIQYFQFNYLFINRSNNFFDDQIDFFYFVLLIMYYLYI